MTPSCVYSSETTKVPFVALQVTWKNTQLPIKTINASCFCELGDALNIEFVNWAEYVVTLRIMHLPVGNFMFEKMRISFVSMAN